MFGGTIYTKEIDGWQVSWESLDGYRFWCHQEHPENSRFAAVVMLNPGSLSGNGANLGRDTTLRVLRDIFRGTTYNPFIINLFNLATPKPYVLFEQWERRDYSAFNYSKLPLDRFSAVMYAYGDYENGKEYPQEGMKRGQADLFSLNGGVVGIRGLARWRCATNLCAYYTGAVPQGKA